MMQQTRKIGFLRRILAGRFAVYARVTDTYGQRAHFSTGIYCTAEEYKKRQINEIGREMERIASAFMAATAHLTEAPAQALIELYLSGANLSLHKLCSKFIDMKNQSLDVAPRTIQTYETHYHLTIRYVQRSVAATSISERFLEQVRAKMRADGLSHNYINKMCQFLSQACKFGVREGILDRNPLEHFSYRWQKSEIVFLQNSELATIRAVKLSPGPLAECRDLFVFQCETGLAYADLCRVGESRITWHHGRAYLSGDRQKSGSGYFVPVDVATLEKIKAMPMPSNQYYNRLLKELAYQLSISKKLTTHVARKTAGMHWLNMGYSMEAVSRMLGHTKISTTQAWYARVLPERVIRETEELNRKKTD